MTTEQRNEILNAWNHHQAAIDRAREALFEDEELNALGRNANAVQTGMRAVLNALGYDIVWPHDEEYAICGDPDIWPMWLIDQNIPELRDLAVIEGLDKTMHEHDDVGPTTDITDN